VTNRLLKAAVFSIAVASFDVHAGMPPEQNASLGAHVHGLSELKIAAEGNPLAIQLISPAMNLVGFERIASTSKEIAAVENAALILHQHDVFFLLSGADCKHINTSIDLSKLIDADDHKDVHQSDSNDDEQKHGHKEHDQNESHSEVIANYEYRCKTVAPLSSVTVALFEAFRGIHKIHAMWVKRTQQGTATLTPNNRIIVFR
jgi:hypothetical protein